MKLHIARLYYPVTTLGPGRRLGIWMTGCPRHCDGCVSEELRSLEYGRPIEVSVIIDFIVEKGIECDGITISGGEPFMQSEPLAELTEALRRFSDDIIVYTGYTYEELLAMHDADVDRAMSMISVLIDGPYIRELDDGKGVRGSSNQRFVRLQDGYDIDRLISQRRRIQTVVYADSILEIGVPGGLDD